MKPVLLNPAKGDGNCWHMSYNYQSHLCRVNTPLVRYMCYDSDSGMTQILKNYWFLESLWFEPDFPLHWAKVLLI